MDGGNEGFLIINTVVATVIGGASGWFLSHAKSRTDHKWKRVEKDEDRNAAAADTARAEEARWRVEFLQEAGKFNQRLIDRISTLEELCAKFQSEAASVPFLKRELETLDMRVDACEADRKKLLMEKLSLEAAARVRDSF